MHVTRFSDIALRLLMYLSREHRETPAVTVAEVARQFGIPHNHLTKVVGLLAKHGYIEAIRGRSGGLKLARQADDIRLGAVMRILESDKELIDCAHLQCRLTPSCGLREALFNAQNAFFATLDEYTLADIAGGKTGDALSLMHGDYLKLHLAA
jgi:Rrf2 family nitric oxide-sensitive transcriptional repressor